MELQDIDLKELIERETGEHFNRQGYIKCPFHNEKTPSLSIKFFPDANKYKFKCFGCGEVGDAIDFIEKIKNMTYNQAREYLGLTVEKSVQEQQVERVQGFIDWQIKENKWKDKLIGLFPFTNDKGEIAYFKAKFKNDKGEKRLSYYHIEGDNVINKRGSEELPYNLYNVIEGIKNGKVIIICEGEKDVNNLNSVLKRSDCVATSVKNAKDLSMYENAYLYICGDTGEAGEIYKWSIYKKLFRTAKSFKFINLPGIKNLGDNKDVTDWLEVGHDKKDLLNVFDRSLDLKSEYELQQNKGGIYKIAYKGKGEDAEKYKKYLTNFNLVEATRISFEDEDQEGVKLVLKSPTGHIIEKVGVSTVFDDVRSFRNFLGTLDLSFKGRVEELVDLKDWINKYFALELEEIHQGVKFTDKNGNIIFITNDGAIGNGKVFKNIKSNGKDNVNIMEIDLINKEELKEIKKHIFKFATPDKTIPIIGTVINDLAVYQNQQIKQKLHHLLIVGESGSGKSTIIENVIIPILNYPKNAKEAIGAASPFGMIKGLSLGNYPKIYDEFKPSRMDRYKILKISDILRNLYDRDTVSRGNKSLNVEYYQLNRPVIIAGEESYPNQEKALIERSCIVYLGKRERTEKHTQAMKWITENESILNKFGRSLIDTVLNLKVEEYAEIRKSIIPLIKGLKDRPSNTAINICCGIEIFNILLKKNDIAPISNYVDYVMENIKTEVLENGVEIYSAVESMLNLYNDLIEDGRAYEYENVVKYRGDGIFIKTTEMINQINEYINKVGNTDVISLGVKDFRKQAMKAGYLNGVSNKVIKVNDKSVKFDTYSKEMLRKLKVNSIIPPELEDVTEVDNIIPFK
ncbi:CHC2 zinc finger domain-containing protein [Clostridium sp. 001]|uniref:CHC2 zinc finger domain-containing protein n=1 Tax=Clostridium sp. 001 TaxID=1970093 RepID=UPI001C2C2D45|nr:CHC2 zinc finger domain-containing protein [Clostridium sp. 001]QXE19991.1 DNA primase [Clostridium sp. 001]